MTPLTILRNPNEGVLIEATINSVRVSVKMDTHEDNLEVMLLDKFQKFLVGRAERFLILRRKPVKVRPAAGLPSHARSWWWCVIASGTAAERARVWEGGAQPVVSRAPACAHRGVQRVRVRGGGGGWGRATTSPS